MIQRIRTSRISKVVASYLAIQMIVSVVQPSNIYALTGGPSQPEFNSFTPIGTSDMVNLSSGDFNYNIPIMDVGGYPLNLAYDSGVGMDQEASWVGLGWNLNVGQINRQVRGIPDDFNGDLLEYEDNMRENRTTGLTFNINPQFVGLGDMGLGVSAGMTFQYNNYTGISFEPSYGISFNVTKGVSVGMSLTSSAANGATANPYISLSQKMKASSDGSNYGLSASFGVGYNSRQGLTSFNMNAGASNTYNEKVKEGDRPKSNSRGSINGGGNISFVNNTFTPTKRTAFSNSNISFAFSLGLDIWGIDAEFGVTGFGSIQKLKEAQTSQKAYGYNFTHYAQNDGVLDFNREKEDVVSKNTLVLPATNYTYDIYQINGQGTGGMFRPFRSQVGHVYSRYVQDEGDSNSLGVEVEAGAGWHVGVDFTNIDSESSTGKWESPIANYFNENIGDAPNIDYESVYYKAIGEYTVDNSSAIFNTQLGGNKPIRIGIGGAQNSPGKYAENIYYAKENDPNSSGTTTYSPLAFNNQIKRSQRELRNKAIVPVTHLESEFDPLFNHENTNANAKDHHIVGYKSINPDGSRYIYGETVYNTEKVEATFAVAGNAVDTAPEGTVSYSGNDNSQGNSKGTDNYFNSVKTPAYAHTYLLSSVLSADYEDLLGDGPSIDDMGAYTKFNYQRTVGDYHWSIPYENNKASFNQGLNTDLKDDKGSVVSGKKELKYINTIETKTHVAYFRLLNREDGLESGVNANSHMKHIDKIFLYSKPEYDILTQNGTTDPNTILVEDLSKPAIKVAHFTYNYELCKGIPNSSVNGGGKLTLQNLHFTYRDSQMGAYTPYTFEYNQTYTDAQGNPQDFDYSLKAYDVWGNYKPNKATNYNVFNNPLSPQEFPFVQQDDKELQDQYASAWSLASIQLPSGGKIDVDYETDDYQYVQDKKAMRMFKVVGASKTPGNIGTDLLYEHGNYNNDAKYLIVEIPEDPNATLPSANEFTQKYLGEHLNKPIYFRFMMNMSKDGGKTNPPNSSDNKFDYVTGYFLIDSGTNVPPPFEEGGKVYGAIPMEFSDIEGGVNGNKDINPISKAGIYFGRKHLHREVYGLPPVTNITNIVDIITQLKADISALSEIISGPNAKLRNEYFIAKRFVPEKSWIRLQESTGKKLGGGVRVSKIQMHDQWDQMLDSNNPNSANAQFYGQEYSYTLDDGTSAGVATYEPNSSKENPFVEPFYNDGQRLVAPRELNYVEKPFGESFFPSPTVTYSKVEVKNLSRERQGNNGPEYVTKHATGKVVNEFFTSKNFPTIADYTDLDGPDNYYSNDNDIIGQTLSSLLGLNVEVTTELTLSQGFSVQTNDMNGKQKKQSVYSEFDDFISGAEYKYSVNELDGTLNNKVPTIQSNGEVSATQEVGMHYEVINDFNESKAYTRTLGLQTNVAALPFGPFIVVIPMITPQSAEHTNTFHSVTTTKVINRTGIMTEKIAYDVGANVTTKNLAWDAQTGEVLLTETINEYQDHYYSFNYPAYWYYNGMDMATRNIGIEGVLSKQEDAHVYNIDANGTPLSDIFYVGDEIQGVHNGVDHPLDGIEERLWVASIENNEVVLINRLGDLANDECAPDDFTFKIVRSGYRNQQTASMASVTSMLNPIDLDEDGYDPDNDGVLDDFDPISATTFLFPNLQGTNPRIVNASAVEYSEAWAMQWENNLPKFPNALAADFENINYGDLATTDTNPPQAYGFNPYLYNVRGEWRAKRSHAYLTGRQTNPAGATSPRHDGFFTKFSPFYQLDNSVWGIDNTSWTFASQVSQYSPFGAELENKDALDRYSAAQYGYNYTLPTAVASNSQYREIGFDGFEDYGYANTTSDDKHFGFLNPDGTAIVPSEEASHTGRNSLKVTNEASLTIDYRDDGEFEASYDGPDDCTTIGTGPPITVTELGCTCDFTVVDVWKDRCKGTCEADYLLSFENIPDLMTATISFDWLLDFTDTGGVDGTLEFNVEGNSGIIDTQTGPQMLDGSFNITVNNTDEILIELDANAYAYCGVYLGISQVTVVSAIIDQTGAPLTISQNVFFLDVVVDSGVPCH